jgi:hypothetical protein
MYPLAKMFDDYGNAKDRDARLRAMFNFDTSTHFAESISSTTGFEGFKPVAENGAYPSDQVQESFNKIFKHTTWKDKFSVSRELVNDENLGAVKRLAKKFTNAFDITRERFGAALYGAAIAGNTSMSLYGVEFSSSAASADGRPMFDTQHPSKVDPSFTQSNCFSDMFSQDALSKIQSRMIDYRDDNAAILEIVPDTILLPNDAAAMQYVFGVLGSDKQPDTANNNWNFHVGAWDIIFWPYLNEFISPGVVQTGAFPWIVMSKKHLQDFDGAVWYEREALSIDAYEDKNTDAAIWKGRARWSAGFFDWRAYAIGGIARGVAL